MKLKVDSSSLVLLDNDLEKQASWRLDTCVCHALPSVALTCRIISVVLQSDELVKIFTHKNVYPRMIVHLSHMTRSLTQKFRAIWVSPVGRLCHEMVAFFMARRSEAR